MKEYFPANSFRLKRPFWHEAQKRAFDRSCDAENFAIWHSPRVGKSDIVCVKSCYQHSLGNLWGVIVIAWPSGAHFGWIRDIYPAAASVPWQGLIWTSAESATKGWQRRFEELLRFRGLAVLAMNVEAVLTTRAKEALARFCKERRRVMVVNDESSSTANADARRTKTMLSLSRLPPVAFRYVLDGTPVDRKGPLDYYSQMGFLDFNILGYPNQTEFRNHYAQIKVSGRAPFWAEVKRLSVLAEQRRYPSPKEWALRAAQGALIMEDGRRRRLVKGRDYWESVEQDDSGMPIFRNMDELHRRLDPVSDRCTFAQAFPDAERQVFAKRYFELTSEQRRVYGDIEEEFRALLRDGTEIKASHHLTRTLRLQQVASNYYPDQRVLRLHEACAGMGCERCGDSGVMESEEPLRLIDDRNPRMEALEIELKEDVPTIIWARFRQDVTFSIDLARRLDRKVARYDGQVSARDKLEAREGFQAGRYNVIVGNWAAMSRGIPLHRAAKHVCVSNGWSFRTRKQGEERSEHGGKRSATSFVDLVALDTVDDQQIIPALRQGMDVSAYVLRDERREWI